MRVWFTAGWDEETIGIWLQKPSGWDPEHKDFYGESDLEPRRDMVQCLWPVLPKHETSEVLEVELSSQLIRKFEAKLAGSGQGP